MTSEDRDEIIKIIALSQIFLVEKIIYNEGVDWELINKMTSTDDPYVNQLKNYINGEMD